MINRLFNIKRQTGFSLVELTVVLLIITLLTSVAVRETSELAFQTRYEQTKERLEMIRQAILGNPKLIANGQQAVSGFVADMGRLPRNIRELIQRWGDCNIDKGDRSQAECAALSGTWTDSAWSSDAVADIDPETGLRYGWNGPYLSISGNPADSDALTDGWGTTSDNLVYGWRFEQGLNPAMLGDANTANDQTDPEGVVRLVIQSLGRDQATNNLPTGNYIDDYPPNLIPNDAGKYYPNPLIEKGDWLIDISAGLTVIINRPSITPPHNHCTKPSYITKTACEANGGVWLWGCSQGAESYNSVCPSSSWAPCSKSAYTAKNTCESNGGLWFGDGKGCDNSSRTTKAECTSPSKWKNCSDSTYTVRTDCEANDGIWFGEYCTNPSYTTKTACESNGKVWQSDEGYGCNPYSADKATCTGTWTNFERGLCMKIYFRSGASIDVSTGHAVLLEDGSRGTITFRDFSRTAIPLGDVKLGIYYKHGTQCTDVMYPEDSRTLIHAVFQPKTGTPVINW